MTQREILADLTETEVKPSKPLFEREQIPNTPFWIIGNPEVGYHITMGRYKITYSEMHADDIIQAMTIAKGWLENNKWDVILTVALCAITDVTYKDEFKTKKP